ncbi:hypothetical protein [Pseudonocardia sp. HH130630-07]|uniref:hypothetical protein n=1 Tax=Pseudonocardia sp. HH130630-07 TaxID=1690815 RepID=UPI000814CA22|nr:hypothetical protein [Pseudonocardia sp. HH130630-07]ANY06056.1 hypothetical protein AFB00_06765 [Pseudonocardia sp. HH130630-07]
MLTPGSGVVLLLVVLLAAGVLLSPPGRRMVGAVGRSVWRWPGLIRSELRGDAPLDAATPDGGETPQDRHDTTPEIPVVRDEPLPQTRGLPQLGRPTR